MLEGYYFYLIGVPAVLLFGISKGGFGGSISILAVPLLTLVVSPAQAAALLLPILCVMDLFVIYTYRSQFDATCLRILVPGALLGIIGGYLTFEFTDENITKILIGVIAIIFVISTLCKPTGSAKHRRISGTILGGLSGFTSFVIHAGGPPFSMYLLPKKLDPLVFAGTAGIFFCIVNYVKIIPYYLLEQLNTENLKMSLILMPFAPVGVFIGHWLVKRVSAKYFYIICYIFLFVAGLKLIVDGIQRFY